MTPSITEIIHALEAEVSPGFQESWDNTGWQIKMGGTELPCNGVMVCVDVTPDVIDEAINKGCNLIISHHPLIFKPLRKIVGNTPAERMVMTLISKGISVYSAHTSLDNVGGGVSVFLADALGLINIRPLSPRQEVMWKIAVYVPVDYKEKVAEAMSMAGAGHIGDYDSCSFEIEGVGSFRPLDGSNPFIGQPGEVSKVKEVKIEMVVPEQVKTAVLRAIEGAHPYEEPAIDVYRLEMDDESSGLGAVGDLTTPLTPNELIARVKEVYGSPMVRVTPHDGNTVVSRVALCGGSGGEFIPKALRAGAQAYITSDVRYHDFVDYRNDIIIIDTGHYESEKCTTRLISQCISKIFPNFAVNISQLESNSITYR